jgi:hypothetical protein
LFLPAIFSKAYLVMSGCIDITVCIQALHWTTTTSCVQVVQQRYQWTTTC